MGWRFSVLVFSGAGVSFLYIRMKTTIFIYAFFVCVFSSLVIAAFLPISFSLSPAFFRAALSSSHVFVARVDISPFETLRTM